MVNAVTEKQLAWQIRVKMTDERDIRAIGDHLDEPEHQLPAVWQAAFAWCPPPKSRLLGARNADGVGAKIRPDTGRFRRLRLRSRNDRRNR